MIWVSKVSIKKCFQFYPIDVVIIHYPNQQVFNKTLYFPIGFILTWKDGRRPSTSPHGLQTGTADPQALCLGQGWDLGDEFLVAQFTIISRTDKFPNSLRFKYCWFWKLYILLWGFSTFSSITWWLRCCSICFRSSLCMTARSQTG